MLWFFVTITSARHPSYPEPDQSSPHLPIPHTCEMFHHIIGYHQESLLAPCPIPKLEDHPLLAVHNCLFNVFTRTLHI